MNNTNEKPAVYGQIKEGYFLREYVGDGEADGVKFELAHGISTGVPMVLVGKKAFLLSWEDILNLAEAAGLFGVEAQSEKETIKFASPQHRFFYKEKLAKVRKNDCYHRALIYALGITEDTRNHFNEIFDIKSDCINADCIHAGWVTGTDVRAIRLAYNLYTGFTPEGDEVTNYTVQQIFEYGCTEYFLQTVALRFE